jgi:predicted metal-dependent enzyme (double-stranded beta helix superfamily)
MNAPRPVVPGLSLDELAAVTQRFADEVRAGCHEVYVDPARRWHTRIHADDRVDVWLISWTTDQDTELHDHGASAGAFTVVSGTLTEAVWRPSVGLVEGERRAGETVVFPTGYVHDVRNGRARYAVSVHAYSPPLRLMHYYDVDGGELARRGHAWTDDPESPAPERRAS